MATLDLPTLQIENQGGKDVQEEALKMEVLVHCRICRQNDLVPA